MKDSDLLISNTSNVYHIKVNGRANFEYAVPLRHLANCLNNSIKTVSIDGSNCTFMDSTFMGVLSMIGLKCKKLGAEVEIYGMAPNVKALLKGLGVDKLFKFIESKPENEEQNWEEIVKKEKSLLDTAETVAEAHKVLVEADDSNQERFKNVIKFADMDLERIRNQENNKK